MSFLDFSIIDFIDIVLVAFLLFKLYKLIRGSVAINIFTVIALIYFFWLITRALNMQLLSSILGQFIGVGMLAIVIVFQPEIRRFFLLIYAEYISKFNFSLEKWFRRIIKYRPGVKIYAITKACLNMSKSKTGALLVISDKSPLESYANTGTLLHATTSSELIESIFFKNSPLHDGAVIIYRDKIIAAKVILPISENASLPPGYGLRHRSAMGISEATDTLTIAVSEETGEISSFRHGKYQKNITGHQLRRILEAEFLNTFIEEAETKEESKPTIISQIDLNPFKN
jgi:diadenylate cyclase